MNKTVEGIEEECHNHQIKMKYILLFIASDSYDRFTAGSIPSRSNTVTYYPTHNAGGYMHTPASGGRP